MNINMNINLMDLLENIGNTILNSQTVAIVIGALVAAYFGFDSYKKQRERENINRRYFEKGIENLIDHLNNIRMKIEENYENSLNCLKYFRDLNNKDFLNWLKNSELEYKRISSKMPESFFITSRILEDEYFSKSCINILVDCGNVNDFFFSEIPLIFQKYSEDPQLTNATKKKLAERLNKEIVQKYEKVYKETKLYRLIESLEKILLRLREMNLNSYSKLKEIKNDRIIKTTLSDFKKKKK